VIAAGEAPPAPSSPAEEPAEVPEEEAGPEFFVVGDVSGREGSAVIFTVMLDQPWGQRVSVDYYTESDRRSTATPGVDYEVVAHTLWFTQGRTSQRVTVSLHFDGVRDDEETFRFCLWNPSAGSVRETRRCATATVRDGPAGELPSASVTISGASEREGETLEFAVQLSSRAPGPVSMEVATVELSGARAAKEGEDYRPLSGPATTLRIPAGADRATVRVEALPDDSFELPENLEVRLSGVVGATWDSPEALTATGTIIDVAPTGSPVLSVDDATATESAGEISFVLTLDEPSGVPVVAVLATRNGTALAGDDYEALAAGFDVTIPAGQRTGRVRVVVLPDDEVEGSEWFVLSIESATAAVSPTAREATGTIVDDVALPVLTVDNAVPVTEGEEAIFTLRLSRTLGEDVPVSFEFRGGDATAGSNCNGGADYAVGGLSPAVIKAGFDTVTVRVPTCDDAVPEALREVFTLRPTRVHREAATFPAGESGVGTILDNDGPPAVRVGDASAREDAGEVEFTVRLDRASAKAVSLRWWSERHPRATYPANPGVEFAEMQGSLRIEPGRMSTTVAMPIFDDSLHEYDELFRLRLGTPTDGTLANATIVDGVAVGTIEDDDEAPLLAIGDAEAFEGEALSFEVRLVDADGRSTPSGRRVTVNASTSDDTATAGEDYTAVARDAVEITAGVTRATVIVQSTEDEVREDDETFLVYLAGNANAGLADDGWAVGTILDDEDPRLSVADVTVTEGADGEATFVVALSHAAGADVTFSYTPRQVPESAQPGTECDATAEDPADYLTVPATAGTIAAGNTEFTVDVAVCDDDAVEDAETFLLAITGIDGAKAIGSVDGDTAAAVGTILDDDGIPRITVGDAEASEGDGTIGFAVTLSHAAETDITLHYRTIDGTPPTRRDDGDGAIPTVCTDDPATATASPTTDYVPATGTLTVRAGDTEATIDVAIRDDRFAECPPREYFTLRLALPEPTDPDEPVAELPGAEAIGIIIDDDPPSTVFVYDARANEDDGTVTVRIELDKPHDRTIRVPYRTADGQWTWTPAWNQAAFGSLAAPTDYTAIEGTLVFPPGSVAHTVTITLVDNDDELEVEVPGVYVVWQFESYFWVLLGDQSVEYCEAYDYSVNYPDTDLPDCGLVLVRDDEQPHRVAFVTEQPSRALESAGTVEFLIGLSGYASDENITVEYHTEPLGANIGRTSGRFPEATPGDDYVQLTSGWGVYGADGRSAYDCKRFVKVPDQTASPGSVTISAGKRTATFSVEINDDTDVEGLERFQVGLLGTFTRTADMQPTYTRSNAAVRSGDAILPGSDCATSIGTIIDDDAPPVLTLDSPGAPEDGGMLSFRAALSRPLSSDVTAGYATADIGGAGSATAGEDYEAARGTLRIPAGDLSAFIDVTLIDDDVDEGSERFRLDLSGLDGATAASSRVFGTIIDDERNDLPVLTVADVSFLEDVGRFGQGRSGQTGYMYFDVQFSKPNTRPVSFTYGIEEVLSLGDYAARRTHDFRESYRGSLGAMGLNRATVEIEVPDDEGCWLRNRALPPRPDGRRPCYHEPLAHRITLNLVGDNIPERDERLRLWLSDPVGVVLGDTEAWGTILNNDQPILSMENVEVPESAAEASFELVLHAAGLDPVSVHFRTVDIPFGNAANPGEDYTETTGTVTFAPGSTTATVSVPIRPDTVDEPDEAFVLQLHGDGDIELSDAEAVALIVDDDPGWWIGDAPAAEGAGTMRFVVRRDEPAGAAITLRYTTYDGGATGGTDCTTDGVDYITPSGEMVFGAGVTEATIEVTVCDDAAVEGGETFTVSLDGVTGRRTTATGTITDND